MSMELRPHRVPTWQKNKTTITKKPNYLKINNNTSSLSTMTSHLSHSQSRVAQANMAAMPWASLDAIGGELGVPPPWQLGTRKGGRLRKGTWRNRREKSKCGIKCKQWEICLRRSLTRPSNTGLLCCVGSPAWIPSPMKTRAILEEAMRNFFMQKHSLNISPEG